MLLRVTLPSTGTLVALVETELGWRPCHVRDIKQHDVYYLVQDGVAGYIYKALSDAVEQGTQERQPAFYIDSQLLE